MSDFTGYIGYGPVDDAESARANRSWWDSDAADYHREHPLYLGEGRPEGDFVWCPEMLREEHAFLLGDADGLASSDVLEIGCGSAPCSRWLAAHRPPKSLTAFDVSMGMLAHGVRAAVAAGLLTVQVPDLIQPTPDLLVLGHMIAPDLGAAVRLAGLLPQAELVPSP